MANAATRPPTADAAISENPSAACFASLGHLITVKWSVFALDGVPVYGTIAVIPAACDGCTVYGNKKSNRNNGVHRIRNGSASNCHGCHTRHCPKITPKQYQLLKGKMKA